MTAGGPGRESTEGPPPLYNTNHDFKFSYSEINFQDLSWSFRNLYKSMLEKSSSSQHGELALGWPQGHPQLCISLKFFCSELRTFTLSSIPSQGVTMLPYLGSNF